MKIKDVIAQFDEFLRTGITTNDFCDAVDEARRRLRGGVSTRIGYEYPANIYKKLEIDEVLYKRLPIDGLEYALELLPERESKVLRLRYDEELTLNTVGDMLKCTRERARQLEKKAIERLKKPSFMRIILNGKAAALEYETARKTLEDTTKELITEIQRQKEAIRDIKVSPETKVDINTPIEVLDLSHRAFCALKRAGYSTIGDLMKASWDDLMSTRSLGKKTVTEIFDKLKEWGFERQ